MAAPGDALNQLSSKQRALLALRAMEQKRDSGASVDGRRIRIRPREDGQTRFSLSFSQQRLWFLAKLDPHSAAYNLPMAVTIEGDLDIEAARMALEMLVNRHEALRTTFSETDDGIPVQVVHQQMSIPLPLVDVTEINGEVTSACDQTEARQACRPFDLRHDAPLRAVLVRLTPRRHRLILTMHHIASDGWSMQVLARDFAEVYAALRDDRSPRLEPLPVQYADYAVWQRNHFDDEELAPQLSYWVGELQDAPHMLALPTDRPRPPVQQFQGDWEMLTIHRAQADRLKALVQSERATDFMGLLAVYVVTLSLFANQSTLLVGTPVAGRTQSAVERVLGFFVNTLVVRCQCNPEFTFRDVLIHVRRQTLQAQSNQEVPFERIVDALNLERDLSRHPLFQVLFSYGNETLPGGQPGAPFGGETLRAEHSALSNGTSKFDLTLVATEYEGGYRGIFEYSTHLFDAATIRQIVDAFQHVLRAAVDGPDRRLSELRLVEPASQDTLLNASRGRVQPLPDSTLHGLFAQQAKRTPDAVALIAPEGCLLYRMLDCRARHLARSLHERGVEPGDRVGICASRSAALVIGIIGSLYAGAAYVPLDPDYPAARLTHMVEDAQIDAFLTHSETRDVLAPDVLPDDIPTLTLNDFVGDGPVIEGADSWEMPPTDPEHLAYIVYTSGSTGRAKGVAVTHRGICNEVNWRRKTFDASSDDRLLHNFSFSFDPSVWMLFWPLSVGASVFVVPPDHPSDLPYLIDATRRHSLTVMGGAPSTLTAMIDLPGFEACRSLRHIFSGGEALSGTLASRVGELLPAQLHNVYGPTEAVIDTTHHRCDRQEERSVVPIGKPIANKSAYVLNSSLRLVPDGITGELCVGGAGLARGYQNRPRLTAERFVPDPYAAQNETPGARMYRTGDLVRRLPSGEIAFLGRADRQVKLRGFRVEPEAVESRLVQHPGVAEAAVRVVRINGTDRLIGYCTPTGTEVPEADVLRSHLQDRVPDYVIPSRFIDLEALPQTSSAKIDYDALPEPPSERTEADGAYVAPESDVEQRLCRIWKALLGLDRVGTADNFFALGGDSILSIQVIAQARQQGIELTPQQMFQHQTIAEQAALAGTAQRVDAEQGLVTGSAPLTPIQRWFFTLDLPERHHWNLPVFFHSDDPIGPRTLHHLTCRLTTHHDALRSRFRKNDGQWTAEIAPPALVPATYIDLSRLDSDTASASPVIERAAEQVQRSLNLSDGPLFRMVVFGLDDAGRGRLLAVAHHLVADGVSWRVLLEDLHTLFAGGDDASLPSKTTSLPEWGAQLTDHAEALTRDDLAYWLDRADAPVDAIPQAADLPQSANTEGRTGSVLARLDASSTRSLLQVVPRDGQTRVNDVLMAALALSLRRWDDIRACWVNLEGHGRDAVGDAVDLSRTVGWVSNYYPVRLHTGEESQPPQGAAVLQATRDELRQVPANGFNYVLARHRPEVDALHADLRSLPPAEIVFNYLGQIDGVVDETSAFNGAPEDGGVAHSPLGIRPHLFDITCQVARGQLQVNWVYGTDLHARAEVERLAEIYVKALSDVIEGALRAGEEDRSPDDFDLVDLNEDDLTRIGAVLDAADAA